MLNSTMSHITSGVNRHSQRREGSQILREEENCLLRAPVIAVSLFRYVRLHLGSMTCTEY